MDDGLAQVFNKQIAKTSLGTRIIGRKILCYDWVTSTNDLAHFLARQGEEEGMVVFAKGQTQGRGRFGNRWISPYGKGLYFSFILYPGMPPKLAPHLTLTAALAVARTLQEIHLDGVSIKWPNDILVRGKKVCGILTEMCLLNDRIKYVVSGIGLNVNAEGRDLSLPSAASLKEIARREFDIADLSHIIIKFLDEYYQRLSLGDFAGIIKEVKEFSSLFLGSRVRVSQDRRQADGCVVDFDENGGLILRRDNGLLETFSSGHLEKIWADNT